MILVIFSLFAPSVIPFVENDCADIVMIDLNEEDNQKENKKENKSEIDEKDVFFKDLVHFNNLIMGLGLRTENHYLNGSSQFHQKIHLPPPEHRS
jgi:hypothetical protein